MRSGHLIPLLTRHASQVGVRRRKLPRVIRFVEAHNQDVAIMVVCGLLVVASLALAVQWRHYAFALDPRTSASGGARLRGLARGLAVGALTGLALATLMVGPAGRLAMRLLAATSPNAQGQTTEAGEVVGRITVGGTIGLYLFAGLPFGLAVGLVYVFLARAFPRGLLGGSLYGLTLLVLFSTRVEPLRAENPDFAIVGPGWMAVTAFAGLAVGTGVVAAAMAGRIDAALGEPRWRWLWWGVPLGLLAVPASLFAPPAAVVVAVGCVVYLWMTLAERLLRGRGQLVLHTVVVAGIFIALPGFLTAVADII